MFRRLFAIAIVIAVVLVPAGIAAAKTTQQPVVGSSLTPDGHGTWNVTADGSVYTTGDAQFYGSLSGHHLNAPIVGIAGERNGQGYWLIAADGGVFTFGKATFYGSGIGTTARPTKFVAIVTSSAGYWLAAADGEVIPFGDAHWFGDINGRHLDAPIVSMAEVPDDSGYWLASADGGVFAFGSAPFFGSLAGKPLPRPIDTILSFGWKGYWLIAGSGIYVFGGAPSAGK